ncbi:hypothetical protein N8I77_011612 [Diaporthe amygdali]|uniref:Uncharacterized protein n=1 Tax=Phomopsis amygdali TaxID=1214568 RepID=A0AAD9S741_PHOAM|nr:hypothetical protein N8I77_011612 [Diaporthe amygdali]
MQPTMGTHVGLEMVKQKHLHHWHIIYRVYRAQQPGDPFEEVPFQGVKHHRCTKKESNPSLLILWDSFCETPNNECVLRTLPGPEKPQEPMNAYADVRWYFKKNEECDPLYFEGHKHSPWRNDDIIFHLPYFQFANKHDSGGKGHISDEFEIEKKWCFDYKRTTVQPSTPPVSPNAYIDKIRQSISLWRFKGKQTTDEEHGASQMPMDSISDRLCFETKSFTICMLPFLGDEKANETEGPEHQGRTNCKSWIALVIAPGDIIWGNGNFEDNVNHLLLDGNLARRSHANRKRRHRPRWENKNLKSLRDTDHFQTCLIEDGMRRITEAWVDNIDRATKACHAFNKMVHIRIHRSPNSRSECWRKHVNEDLLSIYRLQKRLESLDATLFNNITNEEQGIWINFRKTRAGRRLEHLEQKGGKRPQTEQEQEQGFSPNEEDKLERKRLHFLLTGCLDRHWDRLCGQRKNLRQRIDELQTLRQLLVELSQTRASLYANDLGDNVMYLTYISILFLPLSFCTSLWAMNHELPFYSFIPTICAASAVIAGLLVFIWIRMWHGQ